MSKLPPHYVLSQEVAQSLRLKQALVALESTVITHGLPHPQNLELARNMEAEVRAKGAVPATIALLKGEVHVGLLDEELVHLAGTAQGTRKVSRRDFGIAIARKEDGGTTVAGTLIAAHAAGIRVFATGGIGGVHRNAPQDISADLPELSKQPVVVVCAGAKAILDIPGTVEYLETMGVPVVGYQTDEFPGFYYRSSGMPVNINAATPREIAEIAHAHWEIGLSSAVLVVVPPPEEAALPADAVEEEIQQALKEAHEKNIFGNKVTPFLLARVSELSKGSSMRANLALLRNNASVAALIAKELAAFDLPLL